MDKHLEEAMHLQVRVWNSLVKNIDHSELISNHKCNAHLVGASTTVEFNPK